MNPSGRHYSSRAFFDYFMGVVSSDEAARMERHLGACDLCVERARREYRVANEPLWGERWVATPAPEPVEMPARPRFPLRAVWASAAAIVVLGVLTAIILKPGRVHLPAGETLEASLTEKDGEVVLARSGRIYLASGPAPAALAGAAKDLLTHFVVDQPQAVRTELQRTLSGLPVRGASDLEPQPLSPVETAVRSPHPVFSWLRFDGASAYRVYVYDEHGTDVWEGSAGDRKSLALPASAPPLLRGQTYSWQVEATVRGEPKISAPRRFVVLDDASLATVAAVEKSYPDSDLLLGSVFERYGLYDEARERLDSLATSNPSSELPARMKAALDRLRQPR